MARISAAILYGRKVLRLVGLEDRSLSWSYPWTAYVWALRKKINPWFFKATIVRSLLPSKQSLNDAFLLKLFSMQQTSDFCFSKALYWHWETVKMTRTWCLAQDIYWPRALQLLGTGSSSHLPLSFLPFCPSSLKVKGPAKREGPVFYLHSYDPLNHEVIVIFCRWWKWG